MDFLNVLVDCMLLEKECIQEAQCLVEFFLSLYKSVHVPAQHPGSCMSLQLWYRITIDFIISRAHQVIISVSNVSGNTVKSVCELNIFKRDALTLLGMNNPSVSIIINTLRPRCLKLALRFCHVFAPFQRKARQWEAVQQRDWSKRMRARL